MKNRLVAVGGVFGVLAVAGQAVGQSVQVELRDSGGALVGSAQNFASGAAINLGTIPTTIRRINVFSVNGVAAIGSISLDAGSHSSSLDVFVGQGPLPADPETDLTEVATNWGGLDISSATQSKLRVAAGISGNITGPVRAATITRLQVGGGINAEIDASGELGAAADIGVIVAGSVGVDGDIGAGSPGNPGFIGSVTTTTGDLLGDVIATSEIGEVLATNGTLGDATTRVAITAVDGIDSVVAEAINADIDAGQSLRVLETTGSQGDFEGRLDVNVLGQPSTLAIVSQGDFHGKIVVRSSLLGGIAIFGDATSTDAGPSIYVGESLAGTVFVTGFVDGAEFGTIDCIYSAPSTCDWQAPRVLYFAGGIGELKLADVNYVTNAASLWVAAPFMGSFEAGHFYGTLTGGLGQTDTDPCAVGVIRLASSVQGQNTVSGDTTRDFISVSSVETFDVIGDLEAFTTVYASTEDTKIRVGGVVATIVQVPPPFTFVTPPWFPGQVILNARGLSGGGFSADFGEVVSFAFDDVIGAFRPYPVREELYPYTWSPTNISGGAIGIVPFEAHVQSSNERNIAAVDGWPTETQFNNSTVCTPTQLRGIEIDMYGPVRIQNPALPAFKVERNFGGTWVDLSPRVVFETREAVAGAGFDRIVVLRGRENYGLPRGTYRVTPTSYEVNGVGNLVCDQLLTTALVPVSSDLEYTFTLQPDCNTNCIADASEPGPVTCNPVPICDPIDFNNDAVFPDDQDLIDYMNVTAGGGCSAGNTCNDIDFNNDGVFPDEQDVIDFFNVLAGAECSNMV